MHAEAKIAPLILASASPRRRDLLAQIGIVPTEILAAEIDETPRKLEQPDAYALRVAIEKAHAIRALHPSARILAADTTVACGRRILGKAADSDEARRFLSLLSGRRHRVYTGVCVLEADGKARHKTVMTMVQFKRLHPQELVSYLDTGEWQGVAGAYRIQGHAARFVKSIHGSYTNVVGLPLCEVYAMLSSH